METVINFMILFLLIAWLVGYIGLGEAVGSMIHMLLVLAVVGILYRLAVGRRL